MLDTTRDTSHYPTAAWPAGVTIQRDPAAAAALIRAHEQVTWVLSVAFETADPVIDPSKPAAVQWVRGRIVAARKNRPDPLQFVPLGARLRFSSVREA